MLINFQELNYKIFEKTNQIRIAHNLSCLNYSQKLEIIASLHATQMKQYNFFSHSNPYNPLLKNLIDRVHYFNMEFVKVTENIVDVPYLNMKGEQRLEIKRSQNEKQFYSIRNGEQFYYHKPDSFSSSLLDAWMNSRGHRKNILDKSVTHLGCGAVLYFKEINRIGDKIAYLKVTQNFGKYE